MRASESLPAIVEVAGRMSVSVDVLQLASESNASFVGSAWIVGPAEAIKGIHAGISSPKESRVSINAAKHGFHFVGHPYLMQRVQLPAYNTWQLLVRVRDPRFLMGDLVQAVEDYLFSPNFTTPLLRSWVPHIVNVAKSRGLITESQYWFGEPCSYCQMTTQHLDEIVSQGLRSGALEIPSVRKNVGELVYG